MLDKMNNIIKKIISFRIIDYAIRIWFGLLALIWIFEVYVTVTPPITDGPCEAGQEEWSTSTVVLIAAIHVLVFCLAWYATRKKPDKNMEITK